MEYTFFVLSLLLFLASFLPVFKVKHWSFRVFDFIRIQILIIQVLVIAGIFFHSNTLLILISKILLFLSVGYQFSIILPYFPYKTLAKKGVLRKSEILLLSVNVLQENEQYHKLIELIKTYQPDILLTMETNEDWEKALVEIEKTYEHFHKIPLENRYGMHFYTKLETKAIKEHFLVAPDRPAIEAHLLDRQNNEFIFWGIHPPPPSPTEKPTSKQKDAELMIIAKMIRENKLPTMVAGDFNSVCWARSSKLFAKVGGLKDARIGKGVYGTFPAKFFLFRFPIDLLYTRDMYVNTIKTLANIDSDHLPILSKLSVQEGLQSPTSKITEDSIKAEVDNLVEEGKKAVKEEEKSEN